MADKDESLFERVADRVSYLMGTWQNIAVWIVLVLAWTLIFALHIVPGTATFLPAWFTGPGYNFPLNIVTTVAELYIGFLVGASTNRSERSSQVLAEGQAQLLASIKDEDDELLLEGKTLTQLMAENTALTREVHQHTSLLEAIHKHLGGSSGLVDSTDSV